MTRRGQIILPLQMVIACLSGSAFCQDQAGEPPLALHEVIQLRVEDKVLVLRTALPPASDEDPRMLSVGGFSGPAEVMNLRIGAQPDGRAVSPAQFRLVVSDDTPGQRSSLVVSWVRGVLDVQRSTHFTGQHRYTRLVRLRVVGQQNVGVNQPPRLAQLMVTEAGSAGRPPVKVGVQAADFATLLREHPGASNEHLRPLMRELGQESVFAPEARVAWQVFADQWQPAEALTKQIRTLLPGLDADDGAERERAGERLAELGPDAALVLMRLDRQALSAEQNARIEVLIRTHTPLPLSEARRLRNEVPFLLDCLNSDDPRIRTAALARLRDVRAEPIEFDPELAVPARGAAVAALRETLVPEPRAPTQSPNGEAELPNE